MADILKLDRRKRVELFLRKFKKGRRYRFSLPIKTRAMPKGEEEFRSPTFSFFGGTYLGYDEDGESLVFAGTPLNDIGRLGECTFHVSIDEKITIKLIPEKTQEK